LKAYQPAFASRPRIVVATKLDALEDPERLAQLRQHCHDAHLEFHVISAITRNGVPELLHAIRRKLSELRQAERLAKSASEEIDGAAPVWDVLSPEFPLGS
jgi:GTP-binding protein